MPSQNIPIITIHTAEQLRTAVEAFLDQSEACFALVIDRGGAILSECGAIPPATDPTIVSALAAGSFAAIRELALRVGEVEFKALHQEGCHAHILMSAIDDDAVLVTVFGAQTTLGLVRFYSARTVKTLAELLAETRNNQREAPIFSQADLAGAGTIFHR